MFHNPQYRATHCLEVANRGRAGGCEMGEGVLVMRGRRGACEEWEEGCLQ